MYCIHILLKKAALSLDDGLHPASEGQAGLGHYCLVHGGKVLLNPILHTWIRDSCFICDGSSAIRVFP